MWQFAWILTVWPLFGFISARAEPGPQPSPQLRYFQSRLHQALENEDWYAAKQALNQLRNRDAHHYEEMNYEAVRAHIAKQEKNWQTAYESYYALDKREPATILEQALCLEAMHRYKEARDKVSNTRITFRGEQRWARLALLARCHLALGDMDKAVRGFRELTSRKAPAFLRIPAYQNLLTIYYDQGDVSRGRALAKVLQEKRKGSDAALFSVVLQEKREETSFLDRVDLMLRFAEVSYANRDFERSDHYYQQLIEKGDWDHRARARYFIALTHLKQGKAREGRDAFQQELPHLEDTAFEGPAAFQYARALYMLGLDDEVLRYVKRFRSKNRGKWVRECTRLEILALRRMGNRSDFLTLGERLTRESAPGWLQRYFHRNGAIWALRDNLPERAFAHLEQYRRYRMKTHEQQEALLWEGLIHWEMNRGAEAVDTWMQAAFKDPNHYFGIAARDLIRQADKRHLMWTRLWKTHGEKLDSLNLDGLRELYFLAPTPYFASLVGDKLRKRLPDHAWLERLNLDERKGRAAKWAEIGRYDLAAQGLNIREYGRSGYHYLKSLWYQRANELHDSIRHAEILLNSYPRWLPYELIPSEVQKLAFPKGFGEIVQDKAGAFQVDPYLLLAIIREESKFDHHAKSWASARGLMQFIPETARGMAEGTHGLERFSLPMLYDPGTSITLGAKYVNHLLDTFDGDPLHAVAAYNAGEQAVDRWRGLTGDPDPLEFVWDVSYSETKYYCQKVLRAYHHYTRVYESEERPNVINVPDLDGSWRRDRAVMPQ